ncbi:hypothetical protein ACOMHN_038248 [Nucella lapillus]
MLQAIAGSCYMTLLGHATEHCRDMLQNIAGSCYRTLPGHATGNCRVMLHDIAGSCYRTLPGHATGHCRDMQQAAVSSRPQQPRSLQELGHCLIEEWDVLDQLKVQRLLQSLMSRVQAVVAARGSHTHY